MLVSDVRAANPATEGVFVGQCMGCVGCAVARFETVAEVAVVPGERVLQFETIAGEVQTAAANQIASGRDWAGEALGTLINHIVTTYHEPLRGELTDGYEPQVWGCATQRALYYGLSEWEAAMHVHAHLENNVLFPRALRLVDARVGA